MSRKTTNPFRWVCPQSRPSSRLAAMRALGCRAFVALVAVLLSTFVPAYATPVTLEWVTVGDPGNAADTTGYGAVAYTYQIGKYDVTIQQYTDFLNAVAKTDTYGLFNTSISNQNVYGIARTGSSGSWVYAVAGPAGTNPTGANSAGNRPMTYVSWFDAARFANWMQNGQPTGSQAAGTTETGAYTLNGQNSGVPPAKNLDAKFYIPTENEWYKAAYYKGGGTNAGYWDYATQSDTAPGNTIGSSANQANYRISTGGKYSVTQSATVSGTQNYLTNVGAFTGSGSAYGTFDQNGLVYQWNDLGQTGPAIATHRGIRGGDWGEENAVFMKSDGRKERVATLEAPSVGFRLVAVPEPSTCVMGLAVISFAGWRVYRRRKRT